MKTKHNNLMSFHKTPFRAQTFIKVSAIKAFVKKADSVDTSSTTKEGIILFNQVLDIFMLPLSWISQNTLAILSLRVLQTIECPQWREMNHQ